MDYTKNLICQTLSKCDHIKMLIKDQEKQYNKKTLTKESFDSLEEAFKILDNLTKQIKL